MALRDLVPWNRNEERGLSVRRELSPFTEMERFFDRFLSGWGAVDWERDTFTPRIDVTDKDREVVVTAEIPGMEEKDFDISLTADSLTIHGEQKVEREEKTGGYYRMERSFGTFTRTIHLPAEVDPDKVEAKYHRGVLRIVLPKLPEEKQQRRRIEIH